MAVASASVGAAALIRAVYNVLKVPAITAAAPTGLGTAVYDDVPQTATVPYLRIETSAGAPFNTMGRPGKDRMIVVHIFTAYSALTKAAALMDAVVARLDGAALVVTGYTTWDVSYVQDSDGEDEIIGGVRIIHKIVQCRALLREVA